MLQCLLSKSRLCLCISVEICVNGLRLYYVWQISMHRRWHFYLKGMRKWQEVDSRKEGTWHLLRASSMPDCGLHACFVLGRGENFFLNSQIKSVFKKDRLMGLTSRTLLGKISFWWPKLMGENSNLGTWQVISQDIFGFLREGRVKSKDEGKALEEGWGLTLSLFLQEGGRSWEVAGQAITLFFGKVDSLYPVSVFFFLFS